MNTFDEIVSTPQVAKAFVIREEAHYCKPLSYFRVYYAEDMTPLYMGELTLEAVEARLRSRDRVGSIEVQVLHMPCRYNNG